MLFKEKPENWNSRFEVVACFLEHNEKILLLQRQNGKPQAGTWGLAAGKVDSNETIQETMLREIFEETGIKVLESDLEYLGKLYVKYSNYDFIYHSFRIQLSQLPSVVINQVEHSDFSWKTIGEALEMNLIEDLRECVLEYY